MRLYTFINFYLSPIQQGIQTAHIVHELYTKYMFKSSSEPFQLTKWATKYKTIIVLNGGSDIDIGDIVNELSEAEHHYPWTEFHEDAGLGYIRTGVGVVLPEEIYDAKRMLDGNGAEIYVWVGEDEEKMITYREGSPLFNLIKLIKSKRLA